MDDENNFEPEDDIDEDYEDDDDFHSDDCDGHPAWYEPQLCWSCNLLYMPRSEDSWYCDYCESKQIKLAKSEQD